MLHIKWLYEPMYTIPAIEKLGGREAVADALKRTHKGRSPRVTTKAISMWVSRDSIPGFAVVQMLELAAGRGISLSPSDFKRRGRLRRRGKKPQKQEAAE